MWAAGVKAPDFLKDIGGLETNRNNQLVVRPTLQTTRDDRIFAIGDCCYFVAEGQTRPVPPRAQAAHQMASDGVRQHQAADEGPAAEAVPSIAITARWCRSAISPPSAA